jgi:hypothetical protein
MKKADAFVLFEIHVVCPECSRHLDETSYLSEYLDQDLHAEGIDYVMTCALCKKEFIIENINY